MTAGRSALKIQYYSPFFNLFSFVGCYSHWNSNPQLNIKEPPALRIFRSLFTASWGNKAHYSLRTQSELKHPGCIIAEKKKELELNFDGLRPLEA